MARRLSVLALLLVFVATASRAPLPARAQTPGAGWVPLPNHVPSALTEATPGQGSAGAQPLTITVVLNRSDESGFQRLASSVQTPGSPNFRHFVRPAEQQARFGPSDQSYNAVQDYLRSQGFRIVQGSANHLTITAQGTRSQAEQAFNTRISDFTLDNQSFFANDADPALPPAIASDVQSIIGLSNLAVPRPFLSKTPADSPASGSSPKTTDANGLPAYPMTFAQAYNFAPLGTTGAGQTIGFAEFDNFSRSDVSAWLSAVGLPSAMMNQLSSVDVAGGTPPSNGGGTSEVLLDVDTAMGMAPGANYIVYDAPNNGTSFQTMFNAMLQPGSPVTIISNSWGYCEGQTTAADVQSIDSILASAATGGVSVFTASGDSGNVCGRVGFAGVPADAPHGIAVGGTTLTITNTPSPNSYAKETYWNHGGSGGYALSRFFAAPSYQTAWGVSSRSIPDLSANADPYSGIMIVQSGAQQCCWGGTSMATPEWAAGTALINQLLGGPIGNGNFIPTLYANSADFHSAASMSSTVSKVGLGSFNLASLATSLGGTVGGGGGGGSATPPGSFSVTASATSSTSATVNWTAPAPGTTTSGPATITGYTVASNPAVGSPISEGPSTTSMTFTGLTAATNYTFTVTATNSAGLSTPETSASITTPAATGTPTAPGAPASVSVPAAGIQSTSALVTWTAPSSTGVNADGSAATITSYAVTATPASGTPVTKTVTGSPLATSATLTGLAPQTSYTVTVTATNSTGLTGPASAGVPFTTQSGATAPATVSGVQASATSRSTATVNWTAPAPGTLANGSAATITGYTVTAKSASGGTVTVSSSSTSAALSGLRSGTTYTVTVTATNNVPLTSSPSTGVKLTTPRR